MKELDNEFNLDDFALNEPVADKKPNRVPIAFRVPQDVKDWIERYAIYEGCYDISQFMNKLIKDKMDYVDLSEPDYMSNKKNETINNDNDNVTSVKEKKQIPEWLFIQMLFLIFITYSYFLVSFIFWDLNPINWSIYGRLIFLFLFSLQKITFIIAKKENIKL